MTNRFINLAAGAILLLAPALGHAQLFQVTKQQLIELTSQNPFDRFADDRPIIPDDLLDRAGGMVVDGAVRDLEGISDMMMPAYFRKTHPTAISNVSLTGINIPVKIGNVTVMPGDMVVGDPEGVYFVPPQLVKGMVDNADVIHIHDEWTRKKFDEGMYKSSEIYGSPRDPALKKEYDEYLKKRLEEIRKK